MVYQILVALLKFDFIFFLGFSIQFAVINLNVRDPEFSLTIAAIPITVLGLIFAAWALRHEKKWGMLISCVFMLAGLSYFLFKLIRLYSGPKAESYSNSARRPLATFAVVTLCLLFATLANGVLCVTNFGYGLKHHVLRRTNDGMTKSGSKTNALGDVEAYEMPARAALDDGEGSEGSARRSGLASAGAAMSTSSRRPYTPKDGPSVEVKPAYPTPTRRNQDQDSSDDDDDDDDDDDFSEYEYMHHHTTTTTAASRLHLTDVPTTLFEDPAKFPPPPKVNTDGDGVSVSGSASDVEAMDIADYYAYGQRSAFTSVYDPAEFTTTNTNTTNTGVVSGGGNEERDRYDSGSHTNHTHGANVPAVASVASPSRLQQSQTRPVTELLPALSSSPSSSSSAAVVRDPQHNRWTTTAAPATVAVQRDRRDTPGGVI